MDETTHSMLQSGTELHHQTREAAAEQLSQANSYIGISRWRLWAYVAVNNPLVLLGSREDGRYQGFLIFRNTAYIYLPNWLSRSRFELADVADLAPAPGLLSQAGYHMVSAISGDDRFTVICRGVQFYTAQEGKQPFESLIRSDYDN